MLPGALHHAADANDAVRRVVDEAHKRQMKTGEALDALMRMELVLRSSSRVKTTFAYRIDNLANG